MSKLYAFLCKKSAWRPFGIKIRLGAFPRARKCTMASHARLRSCADRYDGPTSLESPPTKAEFFYPDNSPPASLRGLRDA